MLLNNIKIVDSHSEPSNKVGRVVWYYRLKLFNAITLDFTVFQDKDSSNVVVKLQSEHAYIEQDLFRIIRAILITDFTKQSTANRSQV
jgi:hypothetical protein